MFNKKSLLGALVMTALLAITPAMSTASAAESSVEVERHDWSFAGVFGTYDQNQLQRGFQVFREICSSCHSARLLAFRNLSEYGGPGFSEEQVKALAAEYEVDDPDAEGGRRPAVPADHWPSPFPSDQDARDANGGIVPPDFSVLAKARTIETPFPWWILNYFQPYAEGGPDYIHALLNGYHEEVPEGVLNNEGKPFELPEGKYYNDVYPGHAIGMAPPLADGVVAYESGDGESVLETLEQYSTDVSAFMMWVAEPHLAARKQAGLQVILFLIVLAGMLYLVKRKLWANIEH
ncbi:cytochrome c1 [Devosia sp.]|uniref:cytochrome c1 n=1 Tax=Devosia sp. TaxID=1871048 RepID=UPI003A91B539